MVPELMEMEKVKVRLGFDKVPREYTGEGANISPPIRIEGGKGASMAIIVDDPDAPRGTWVHWVIWNMPVVDTIPQGIPKDPRIEKPFHAEQGMNSGDESGYDGPYPPSGHGPHHYHFKVYVLSQMLDLPPRTDKKMLEKAMEGKILQYGEAVATYERK